MQRFTMAAFVSVASLGFTHFVELHCYAHMLTTVAIFLLQSNYIHLPFDSYMEKMGLRTWPVCAIKHTTNVRTNVPFKQQLLIYDTIFCEFSTKHHPKCKCSAKHASPCLSLSPSSPCPRQWLTQRQSMSAQSPGSPRRPWRKKGRSQTRRTSLPTA